MSRNIPIENKELGSLLSGKLKQEMKLNYKNMEVKKDSSNSHNYTITFPIPKRDLTGRSKVEKIIKDFYKEKGFNVKDIDGGQLVSKNKDNYLIGMVRNSSYLPGKYSIRIAKTENSYLFK